MKKIIAVTALFLFATCGVSFGAALASGGITAEGDSIFGGPDATAAASATEAILVGKLSKGVKAGFNYDFAGYAVDTKHTAGTQQFGTADDSTAIYRKNTGDGALAEAPSASSNLAFATWTEM